MKMLILGFSLICLFSFSYASENPKKTKFSTRFSNGIEMNYRDIIASAPVREVRIAQGGLKLFDVDKIDQSQVGYSIDPKGNDLTGDQDGDWKTEWVVIGQDTLTGDPIFIDSTNVKFPVFTAMHGQGTWAPKLYSPSLENFLQSLKLLKDLQIDFEEFKKTKLSDKIERKISKIHNNLLKFNDGCEEYLWELLLESLEGEIETIREFD